MTHQFHFGFFGLVVCTIVAPIASAFVRTPVAQEAGT